ncbi:MAG: alkaline phosphatase family protein [Thermomicrobiales bacterium]
MASEGIDGPHRSGYSGGDGHGSSTYLTGKTPAEHGAVANGWYFRDMAEVKFWRQSNTLVQSPKITGRKIPPSRA